jgi:hypothetical protein
MKAKGCENFFYECRMLDGKSLQRDYFEDGGGVRRRVGYYNCSFM